MKYQPLYWMLIEIRMKKILLKRYPADSVKRLLKKGKPIYKELCEKGPNMGKGNPMSPDVYLSMLFIALWLASNKKIRPQTFLEMMKEAIDWLPFHLLYGSTDLNEEKGLRSWEKNHPEK